MKKIKYILAGATLIGLTSAMQAQAQTQAKDSTVNRTVVVEQEYNPDIMDATKVNVLPKVEAPTISKKDVEYDETLAPTGSIPATPMQAYTATETQEKARPGYARLGYGNYGNLDVRGNYLFMLSNSDRLNLNLHIDGRNGTLDLPEEAGEWKSRYYRTHVGMDYTHDFSQVALDVAGHFGLSNFNFLPGSISSKQKFTSGGIHVGVKSTGEELPLQFRAETNLLFYGRQNDLLYQGYKESLLRTSGEVTGSLADNQTVSIALQMDNYFYKGDNLKNYTSLGLNPYYAYRDDAWNLHLGAHVDLSMGFGDGPLVSPDVTAQYNFSESYLLYAQAKGGKLQNDFRRLEALCPYGQLAEQVDDTYEQINAGIGFKASPVNDLWFHLYGGYQSLKNDLVQGEYTVSESSSETGTETYATAVQLYNQDTDNLYIGAEINYAYKDYINLSASGIYRSWSTDGNTETTNADLALAFKPAFEADLHIDSRPISPLLIRLGYRYISREEVAGEKVNAVSNLYLNVGYEFIKNVSIYARLNNLLNKEYSYCWGYPNEGINFVGGVSVRF
ncbi:MAG: TonB-dependent receptor [Bacteroides sp.]|nr:TonB-dependent receptor [Bacteroides sp.]